MRSVLVAGCGFLGEAAAFLFLDAGYDVSGICASEDSASRFAKSSLKIHTADLSDPAALRHLADAGVKPDIAIHCASSRRGREEAYRSVYLGGMQNLTAVFPSSRHLFVSSTSVYAQTDGAVVDENSETLPSRETGRLLLAAEQTCLDAGGIVLRLGGLYGPGRWVLLRKFLSGEATIDRGTERWLNQIHRDDAARAIFHLMKKNAPSGIYNACDNTPVTQRTVYEYFAAHLHRPLPPEADPDLNRKRGWTNKRVNNAKLRATHWQPQFPSFREALQEMEKHSPICP